MSPLLHDCLHIVIGHGQIAISRVKGGLRPRLLAQREEKIEDSLLAAPCQELCAKLSGWLADPEWQAPEADIVLPNKLVRHAVISFDAKLKKYSEQEAYARHVLAGTYGPVVAQWELRIHPQGKAAPAIVSAIDRSLLESLRQTLGAHRIKLRSVTSRLVQEFNHLHRAIQTQPAWMVVHDAGHSQFALLSGGKVVSINSANHQGLHELPALLDRENLVAVLPETCKTVYLVMPEDDVPRAVPDSLYEISFLEPSQRRNNAILPGSWSSLFSGSGKAGKIALDFQRPAYHPNRNAGWMLLAVGVALTMEMGFSYDGLQRNRAAMEQVMAAEKFSLDENGPGKNATQFGEKDFDAARKIVNRLEMPWEAFFKGLESVSNKRVAVLSIVPDMQTGILRVTGEAKDNAALLTLITQFRATQPFSEVFLSSQQVKRDDPQHPVEFTIYMRWLKQS